MRTTVTIPDDLLRRAKQKAVATGRSLAEVVSDALRESLSPRPRRSKERRVKLPTYGQGGLQPGVDLDDSAALLDVMERAHAPVRR